MVYTSEPSPQSIRSFSWPNLRVGCQLDAARNQPNDLSVPCFVGRGHLLSCLACRSQFLALPLHSARRLVSLLWKVSTCRLGLSLLELANVQFGIIAIQIRCCIVHKCPITYASGVDWRSKRRPFRGSMVVLNPFVASTSYEGSEKNPLAHGVYSLHPSCLCAYSLSALEGLQGMNNMRVTWLSSPDAFTVRMPNTAHLQSRSYRIFACMICWSVANCHLAIWWDMRLLFLLGAAMPSLRFR